nr:unnamed protein product [Spirometra erinaceieuropaei]
MVSYFVEIAALINTGFSEQCQPEKMSVGYTFWIGRLKAERRDAEVAFTIETDIGGRLPCLLQGIHDRPMSLRLSIRGGEFTTIIRAYASAMTGPDKEKKKFYEDLHVPLTSVDKELHPHLSYDWSVLLTRERQILKRLVMHFRKVLNLSSKIADANIHRLPQLEINVDLNLSPSISEAFCAVQRPSSVKALNSNTILTESLPHGGHRLVVQLTTLFRGVRLCVQVRHRFKDTTIVHLYKRKGSRQVCDNHRGISPYNIAGKIFTPILLNRLNGHLEQGVLPESQRGFQRHRGSTDMVFADRQLEEKCRDMRTALYTSSVDSTKASDTANHTGL